MALVDSSSWAFTAKRKLPFLFWGVQWILSGFNRALTEAGVKRFAPGEYTLNFPNPYVTYTPWYREEFTRAFDEVRFLTTCTADRAYYVREFAKQALPLQGHFAECGVYKGGMARFLSEGLGAGLAGRRFFLFDSFEGIPSSTDYRRDSLREGDLGDTSYATVKRYLQTYEHFEFRVGWIPHTFNGLENERFAFVHIDVDIYPSTQACYEFFYPRMLPGGVMICDDYGLLSFKDAARAAVDDFMRDKPEPVIQLGTTQSVVIKQG